MVLIATRPQQRKNHQNLQLCGHLKIQAVKLPHDNLDLSFKRSGRNKSDACLGRGHEGTLMSRRIVLQGGREHTEKKKVTIG
jgi:hypothetical protein